MKELEDIKHNMVNMLQLIDSWKQEYHVNDRHEVIFQNKELLSNVRLPTNYLHANHIYNRGFSNLPECIMNPDEVWSFWRDPDPKHQKDAIRNYILYGSNINFVVITESGIIRRAQSVVQSRINRYRKGLIILKS
jgi:hypothetical protein